MSQLHAAENIFESIDMLLNGILHEGTHIIHVHESSRLEIEGMDFTKDRFSRDEDKPPVPELGPLITQAVARLEAKGQELFELTIKVEEERITTKRPDAVYTVKEYIENASSNGGLLILEDEEKRIHEWKLHFWRGMGSTFVLEASHPFSAYVWTLDHDMDYPWVLYFNGEAMPKWANCWNINEALPQPLHELLGHSAVTSRSFIDDLLFRMDAAHQICSEDSNLFRLTALRLLGILLQHENSVLQTLGKRPGVAAKPKEIFHGVVDGICRMHDLAVRDGYAIWTVGYRDDERNLKEAIRRCRLPVSNTEQLELPHIVDAGIKVARELRAVRKWLHGISKGRSHRNAVTEFINHIPEVTRYDTLPWIDRWRDCKKFDT